MTTPLTPEQQSALPGPLRGVRVLDLGDPLAMYTGKLLADLGADVILIEPPGGVPARSLPPFYHDVPGPTTSLPFWFWATSRRSVTCNLDTVDGRALFRRLAGTAAVVLDGGAPDRLEALEAGFSVCRRDNPALVWASVSGFGRSGPHAGWSAPDLVAIAMSGVLTLSGFPDRPPAQLPGEQGLLAAGIQAAQGVLLALRVAERTGRGQVVEVSMQEALSLAQETAMQTWDMQHVVRKRTGDARLLPGIGTYPCADGYVYSLVGVPGFGAPWSVLAAWMAEEGMADDLVEERWQTLLGSLNVRELTRLLADPDQLAEMQGKFAHVNQVLGRFYARFPKERLYEQGQQRRLLIGPVNTAADLVHDRQLNARG